MTRPAQLDAAPENVERGQNIPTNLVTTSSVLALAFPSDPLLSAAHAVKVSVIPQGDEPRWIILGEPRKSLPVLRSWRPFKLKSQLQWNAVLLASSMKLLGKLPGVVTEDASIHTMYWREWLDNFSEDWTAVLHVGNSSYTRKAIVFFIGKDSLVKAVGKIPLTPAAAGAILNEAIVLQHLKSVDDLPRVLFADEKRGVSAQSWLQGKAISRTLKDEHIELLGRLANRGATTRLTDYREEIRSSLDLLDLPFDRSMLAPAFDFLDVDVELPEFVEHRDFAPWNLKRLADGRLTLLDWEWAVTKSLPWQDLCRYFYIQDALFHGPGKVWEELKTNALAQGYVRRFAIPPSALPGLTMYYLLRVLCMDWKNRDLVLAEYTMRQIRSLLQSRRGGQG